MGIPLTMKLTCSAGMPSLESCGLYGNRVAVTEITRALRAPSVLGEGAEPCAAVGVELQPRQMAPTASNPARTDQGRTTLAMVTKTLKSGGR
jgi:hypothetical protein